MFKKITLTSKFKNMNVGSQNLLYSYELILFFSGAKKIKEYEVLSQ